MDGCPSTIHSATALPTPPPCVIQTPSADQNPLTWGDSPRTGIPSGVKTNMPLTFWTSSASWRTGMNSPAEIIPLRKADSDHGIMEGISGASA